MTTDQNKLQARHVYDVYNQVVRTGNVSLLDEVLAVDGIDHDPASGQAPGIDGVKQTFTMFRTAFPDFYFTTEDQLAENDKVVSRVVTRGTHKGDFQGIPATGKKVKTEGIDILRFANGKAVERWGVFDNLGLLQQLGAIPEPA
jgi:steroid delta-isomerase-like uncharacterized protein